MAGMLGLCYRAVVKPVLFLTDPERVHARATALGRRLGASPTARRAVGTVLGAPDRILRTTLAGMSLASPVGLAAGFDYEAKLPGILPSLGFGFGTVGTLTHRPYGGNPRPMLGRLPRSRSLMVYKGFKNDGVAATLGRWRGATLLYPVGVSIGKTNDAALATQEEAVADVLAGFRDAEASGVPFAYYELNISCPNLAGTVEFYSPAHLEALLAEVGRLGLRRPVFVKMPISKPDADIIGMLGVIVRHAFVRGVIIGNVQTDRGNPALDADEVARFPKGNFSGAPCRKRSDELIALAYRHVGSRMSIIGCGGIFSAEDAYRKIRLGASAVQLITGLIYEGPHLPSVINRGLAALLRRDGFTSPAEAAGADTTRGGARL